MKTAFMPNETIDPLFYQENSNVCYSFLKDSRHYAKNCPNSTPDFSGVGYMDSTLGGWSSKENLGVVSRINNYVVPLTLFRQIYPILNTNLGRHLGVTATHMNHVGHATAYQTKTLTI